MLPIGSASDEWRDMYYMYISYRTERNDEIPKDQIKRGKHLGSYYNANGLLPEIPQKTTRQRHKQPGTKSFTLPKGCLEGEGFLQPSTPALPVPKSRLASASAQQLLLKLREKQHEEATEMFFSAK